MLHTIAKRIANVHTNILSDEKIDEINSDLYGVDFGRVNGILEKYGLERGTQKGKAYALHFTLLKPDTVSNAFLMDGDPTIEVVKRKKPAKVDPSRIKRLLGPYTEEPEED